MDINDINLIIIYVLFGIVFILFIVVCLIERIAAREATIQRARENFNLSNWPSNTNTVTDTLPHNSPL